MLGWHGRMTEAELFYAHRYEHLSHQYVRPPGTETEHREWEQQCQTCGLYDIYETPRLPQHQEEIS